MRNVHHLVTGIGLYPFLAIFLRACNLYSTCAGGDPGHPGPYYCADLTAANWSAVLLPQDINDVSAKMPSASRAVYCP